MTNQLNQQQLNELKRDINSEKNILLIQLNCNGIQNKLIEIKLYIYTNKPDIVCLCETFVKRCEPRFVGYKGFWCNREGNRGGLAILIRRDIPAREKNLTPWSTEVQSLEYQCLQVYMKQQWITIMNVYNPHQDISLEELDHYYSQMDGELIMVGDFNGHSPTWDQRGRTNATGRSIEDFIANSRLGLLNDISQPTYIDHRTNTLSCLDLCITSRLLYNCGEMRRGTDLGSDHFPMESTFYFNVDKEGENMQPGWKYSKADWKRFTQLMEDDKDFPIGPLDATTLSEVITQKIVETAETTIGRTSGKRNIHRHTSGWDENCSQAVKRRRENRNKLWKNPSVENLISWKRSRAEARFIMKEKKRESFIEFVNSINYKTPSTIIWRKIKSLGGGKSKNYLTEMLDPSLTNKEKANSYLQHFTRFPRFEISPEMSQHLKQISDATIDSFPPITLAECTTVIKNLKNTSPGEDEVSNRMIKKLPETTINVLIDTFNVSLATSYIPAAWKVGITCPIPKPGKDLRSNKSCRPITMLSCIGKLMERIVQKRIECFLEEGSKLGELQMGFRKGRSTNEALSLIYDQIEYAKSTKQVCIVCFLDLESAFDSVWHEGLLFKLQQLNVPNYLLKWLYNYFQDRKIKVRLGTSYSDENPLEAGVPQGAVLSPTLFNVMLSDLPEDNHIKAISYADDITLVSTARTTQEARNHMQNYLNRATVWLKEWNMKTNPQKSSFQIYTNQRNVPNITLRLLGTNLQLVNVQRVLGILFDAPKLTFCSHITYIKKECEKRIHILRALSSTKWGCTRYLLRRVYVAYIRSKIEYGSIILTKVKPNLLQKLEVVQNQAMRCILGSWRTSPILSLQVESFLPPIMTRFKYLYLRWSNKIRASNLSWILSTGRREMCRTLCENYAEISNEMQFPKMNTSPTSQICAIKPWCDLEGRVSVDMIGCEGLTEGANIEAQMKAAYTGFSHIYTDGSKLQDGSTAAAVYVDSFDIVLTYKLSPYHSVLGAELFAILEALQFVDRNLPHEKVVVFSDSQSALYIIRNTRQTSYRAVSQPIQSLLQRRENVQLQWVKAHIGIKGNETADRAANLAHQNIRSTWTVLSKEELDTQLKCTFIEYWNQTWKQNVNLTQKGKHMSSLLENIEGTEWMSLKNRRAETAISRLRIGHVGLNENMHRFQLRDSPLCDRCGINESIDHFIMHCPEYTEERIILRREFQDLDVAFTLKNVLLFGKHPEPVRRHLLACLATFLGRTGRMEDL